MESSKKAGIETNLVYEPRLEEPSQGEGLPKIVVWGTNSDQFWRLRRFASPGAPWLFPGDDLYLNQKIGADWPKRNKCLMVFGGYHAGTTALVSWLGSVAPKDDNLFIFDFSRPGAVALAELERELESSAGERKIIVKGIDAIAPDQLEGLAAHLVGTLENYQNHAQLVILITSRSILPFDPLKASYLFSELLSRSTLLRPPRLTADELDKLLTNEFKHEYSSGQLLVKTTGGELTIFQACLDGLRRDPKYLPTARELLRLELPTYRVWRRSLGQLLSNPATRADISRLFSRGHLDLDDTLESFQLTELCLTGWVERVDDRWEWSSELRQMIARQVWQATSAA